MRKKRFLSAFINFQLAQIIENFDAFLCGNCVIKAILCFLHFFWESPDFVNYNFVDGRSTIGLTFHR